MRIVIILLILFFANCRELDPQPSFDEYTISILEEEVTNFRLDKPWEYILGYTNVIYKDSIWHLWYESFGSDSFTYKDPSFNTYLCYAYSYDGINWIKPDLDLVYYKGVPNNIVHSNNGVENNGIHGVSIYFDESAEPAEQFKMVYSRFVESVGFSWIFGMVSSDGTHWDDERILLKHHSDTQNTLFKKDDKYKLYYRYWRAGNDGRKYRKIAYASSNYFNANFSSKNVQFSEADDNVHYYSNSARVLNSEHVIMIPSIFDVEKNYMKLAIAVSAINDFSHFQISDSLKLNNAFKEYVQRFVAPQSIEIEKTGLNSTFWSYVVLSENRHDGWRQYINTSEIRNVRLGRLLVSVKRVD